MDSSPGTPRTVLQGLMACHHGHIPATRRPWLCPPQGSPGLSPGVVAAPVAASRVCSLCSSVAIPRPPLSAHVSHLASLPKFKSLCSVSLRSGP